MKYPLSSILQEERKDMTIRECYEKTGSDYENILKRFGSEAMIQRFALKFLKDGSFSDLKNALEQKTEKSFPCSSHAERRMHQPWDLTGFIT